MLWSFKSFQRLPKVRLDNNTHSSYEYIVVMNYTGGNQLFLLLRILFIILYVRFTAQASGRAASSVTATRASTCTRRCSTCRARISLPASVRWPVPLQPKCRRASLSRTPCSPPSRTPPRSPSFTVRSTFKYENSRIPFTSSMHYAVTEYTVHLVIVLVHVKLININY